MSAFGIDWFGLVIPGRPILVNFEMVDPTKCAATIERPGEVAEICFFLTPSGAQLPPDKCAVLYLSLDGAAWTLLGTLSLAKPSGLFRLPSDDARARASSLGSRNRPEGFASESVPSSVHAAPSSDR